MITTLAQAIWKFINPKLAKQYRDDDNVYIELRTLLEQTMFEAFKRIFD